MIFCARGTYTIRMCSSNARNRGSTRLPSKEEWDWDARSRSSISPHPWGDDEQAWKDYSWCCNNLSIYIIAVLPRAD
jgi:hypothetical protein